MISPVTEARIVVRITSEEISLRDANEISSKSSGGLVAFAGVVRDSTEGRQVDHLEYESYDEMAIGQMKAIAREANAKWGLEAVMIVHRTGTLRPGEVSVVVAAAAPHRSEAFDACEFCIDTLKARVAIWKKEQFDDGEARWVNHP